MNQLEDLHKIAAYLSRFSEEVRILNSGSDFSINTVAENMLVGLLNKTYDLQLVNMNDRKPNYPCIDLLDARSRVAVQVTASVDLPKVYDAIEKYYRHGLYDKVDKLLFFSLRPKITLNRALINAKITRTIKTCDGSVPKLIITADEDILDSVSLYNQLRKSNDVLKINSICDYLRSQFDEINRQQDLSAYYSNLGSLFFEVVMGDEKGLTLDQSYVEPSFSLHVNAFKKDEKKNSHGKFLHADHRYKLTEFIDDFLAGTNPLNCAVTPNILLLLGYPGQGKSSLMKKFLHEYISNGRQKTKACYFFALRNIGNAKNFIADPLKTLFDDACMQAGRDLDYYSFSRSVILLDGLDELYMKDNLRMEEVDRLVSDLIQLTRKYKDIQIILTSRYGYVDDEKLAGDPILIAQLSLFTRSDQQEWLKMYSRFHPETWVTPGQLEMINNDFELKYMKELIQQPLSLYIVASLKKFNGKEVTRSRIYDQLFTELIERKYSKDGQLEIFKFINKDDLRKLIREIAFAIHKSGAEHISKTALLKEEGIKQFLAHIAEANLRDSIKGVMIAFYFKEVQKPTEEKDPEDKSNYAIEFLHKSLKEYMIAEKIAFTLIEELLDKRKSSEKYILYHFEEVFSLFQYLFKSRLSLEVGERLREILSTQPVTIKKELEERLLSFFPELLEAFFLKDYNYKEGLPPSRLCANMFHGFWYVVSCVGLSKNYFTKEIQPYLGYFLNLLNFEKGEISGFCFDHQDFSGMRLDKLMFDNCSFSHSVFKNSFLIRVYFYYCDFNQAVFSGTNFNRSLYFQSAIRNCDFDGGIFRDRTFDDCNIESCSFREITAITDQLFERNSEHLEYTSLENCSFENARISLETIAWLNKYSVGCDFQSAAPVAFKTYESIQKTFIVRAAEWAESSENYKRLHPADKIVEDR